MFKVSDKDADELMAKINDEENTNALERAYRRGYHQGHIFAVRALLEGFTVDMLQKFAEEDLYEWRFGKKKEYLLPPELKRKKK